MTEQRARTTPAAFSEDGADSNVHRPGFIGRRRHTRRVRQVGDWLPNRSRKQLWKTVAVCAGVLVLMAVGLYLGLSHQDAQGLPGAARFLLLVPTGTA
jgi:hypothetical protein